MHLHARCDILLSRNELPHPTRHQYNSPKLHSCCLTSGFTPVFCFLFLNFTKQQNAILYANCAPAQALSGIRNTESSLDWQPPEINKSLARYFPPGSNHLLLMCPSDLEQIRSRCHQYFIAHNCTHDMVVGLQPLIISHGWQNLP